MSENKGYLVIGAGPVGLAMAKSLKHANLSYEHVDASEEVGGNWFHGTYKSAHILSARQAMEYPDFLMPDDYPDFPSSEQMLDYYKAYTKKYDLRPNIEFKVKVLNVTPIEDNLWEVKFDNGTVKQYTGVFVCNGHHWNKKYPKYEGTFNGETFHSKDYKDQSLVADKNVLVIGAGNSGFDIASESARSGGDTFLSVRRGIWIFPKTFMGRPLAALQVPKLPDWIQETLVKAMLKVTIGSHKEYGLPKPEGKVFDRHPTVNTEALMHVKHGRIKIRPAIKKLDGDFVEYIDGRRDKVDAICYATGFTTSYPMLPKELDRVEDAHVKVYGFSMYDNYKGLYLVGWMQPRGGVGSLVAPYADMLTGLVKIQERIETPIGNVLKEMGDPLPSSHLYGGGQVIKWINKMVRNLPKIEKKAQKIDKRDGAFTNKVVAANADVSTDMTVF